MTGRKSTSNTVAKLSRVDTTSLPRDGGPEYNRLIFEKSPYLLQHAENPIAWWPWCDEAFALARALDRPVFLSIGYSTCHWCHVMAHESFESDSVASLLNSHFVAIKVDREERPDIDSTYMAVCQMMTGSGGWPLTLLLSPEKKPFFAATYLPKNSRGGMLGLEDLLSKVTELWQSDRGRFLQTGHEVQRALKDMAAAKKQAHEPRAQLLEAAHRQLQESFDPQNGGFGSAPKFPSPHTLSLLLRIGKNSGEKSASTMALKTLQQMRMGGVYDQLGFGLHRYSVDAHWLVPHFEKMLYDQALGTLAYLEAYQVSADPFYGQAAKEILLYLRRDLRDSRGGFYCGEDADSEGSEGVFYTWTPQEIEEVLGREMTTVFCRSLNIGESGHLEGRSIPHMVEDIEELARKVGVDAKELSSLLASARDRLFDRRRQRIRPHRDDKILCGWNGLAIAALARGSTVLDDPILLHGARRATAFIKHHLRGKDGRLLRRWRLGEAAIEAYLEDYAYLVWGLLELFQAGGETSDLQWAIALSEEIERLFDDGQGGYFDTANDQQEILARMRTLQDSALPCGGSVTALNLLKLGRLTGRSDFQERAQRYLNAHAEQVERYPSAYAQYLIALDYALGPKLELILCPGEGEPGAAKFRSAAQSHFTPGLLTVERHPGSQQPQELLPLVEGKSTIDGRPTAYLCREQSCLQPLTTPSDLEKALRL